MLKSEHVSAINRARQILRAYKRIPIDDEPASSKFAEAIAEAEAALLKVLIIAKAWLGSEISESEMFPEEEALPEKEPNVV